MSAPAKKMGRPVAAAPEWWKEEQLKAGMAKSAAALEEEWQAMTGLQRSRLTQYHTKKAARLSASTAGVEAERAGGPKASPYDHTMVRQGGRIQHDDAAGVKNGHVTELTGAARDAEMELVEHVCRWHHFLRTRVQRRDRPVSELPDGSSVKELAQWKEHTGCQHDLHAQLPFTAMLPSPSADPLMYGFLHVSHLLRGDAQKGLGPEQKAALHLEHLKAGLAVVHCAFCHALWTVCKSAAMEHVSPYTADQFAQLQQLYPEFVTNFQRVTEEAKRKREEKKE
jgi:hypothetical protein